MKVGDPGGSVSPAVEKQRKKALFSPTIKRRRPSYKDDGQEGRSTTKKIFFGLQDDNENLVPQRTRVRSGNPCTDEFRQRQFLHGVRESSLQRCHPYQTMCGAEDDR
jgi:hypothetical protein